jgi:hypothetical protein
MNEFAVGTAGSLGTTTAATIVWVNPTTAPNVNLEFMRFWFGQTGTTTSGQLTIKIQAQATAFPTVVAATPAKLKRASAVSVIIGSTTGFPGTAGVTAAAEGAGAATAILDDAFNVLNGWLLIPTPRETIVFPAGSLSGLGLKLGAIGTTAGAATGVTFAEV